MPEEKFLLISLKEDKAKKLSQIISSDTARQILNCLANKEGTETEISKELSLPISTVHYNLHQLVSAGLVRVDEFHYSPKGKEVNHYKLAYKYIIIAPQSIYGIKEKLRSILPVALLVGATALSIQYTSRLLGFKASASKVSDFGAQEAIRAAPMLAEKVSEAAPVQEAAKTSIFQFSITWFLFGALFTLALYLIVDYLLYRKTK